jgi:hypothetical protein
MTTRRMTHHDFKEYDKGRTMHDVKKNDGGRMTDDGLGKEDDA